MNNVLKVLSHTADGVYALNRRQQIVFWNEAAERLLGYRADEVMGRPYEAVFDRTSGPDKRPCRPGQDGLPPALQRQPVPAYNLMSRTKDGHPILLNISVIVPDAESPLVAIYLFRDVSRQLHDETYVSQLLYVAACLSNPPRPFRYTVDLPLAEPPLSKREKEVLSSLMQGKDARQVADLLGIRYTTVRNHLQAILRKLGVHSQREAVRLASKHRLT